MATGMKREDLYEEIWQPPMTNLVSKYGISDIGLRKVLERFNIRFPLAFDGGLHTLGNPGQMYLVGIARVFASLTNAAMHLDRILHC